MFSFDSLLGLSSTGSLSAMDTTSTTTASSNTSSNTTSHGTATAHTDANLPASTTQGTSVAAVQDPPPVLVLEPGQAKAVMNPTMKQDLQVEELLVKLEDTENLGANFFGIVHSNHHIYRFLRSFTISRRYSDMTDGDAQVRELSRLAPFVLIISMMFRLFNGSIYVFASVVLSLLALQAGITLPFWGALVKMRVVYDKPFAIRVAEALGMRRRETWPVWSSTKIALAVGDNCAYPMRTDHEHADEDRKQSYYETINWFLMPLSNRHDAALGPGKKHAFGPSCRHFCVKFTRCIGQVTFHHNLVLKHGLCQG